MKEIMVGKVIASKRKEKGITQEELASYLGVSKPAVSKWESLQTYPDITMLPILATYFDISIDELIGYEPQMSKEEIRKLYEHLGKVFVKEGFEQGYKECKEYIKKYYSCWRLVFNLGVLILNNVLQETDPEKKQEVIEELLRLFSRIEEMSEDKSIAKQAIHLQATCYIQLNKPSEAIDLLDDMTELPMSTEALLSMAYKVKGEMDKARSLLQGYMYGNVVNIVGALSSVMELEIANPKRLESWISVAEKLIDAFDITSLHPSMLATLYINISYLSIMTSQKEQALTYIAKYTDLVLSETMYPICLHGNELFDHIEDYFETYDLGTAPPRDEAAVKESLKKALELPIWESIKEEPSFKLNKKRLEES